jgi:predicted O-methyltransferase YrrM
MRLKMKRLASTLLISIICQGHNLDINNFFKTQNIKLSPVHSKKNEGYMTPSQQSQYISKLSEYQKTASIQIICEIGLNGGHSAETLINHSPDLIKFISFDINHHFYTPLAANYFKTNLGDKFEFYPGDSLKVVPDFTSANPELKADLIYIDGCHLYAWALQDILNCRKLAHQNTYVWIDDVYPDLANPIGEAVRDCMKQGIIRIIDCHVSDDPKAGRRGWIEAMYCN